MSTATEHTPSTKVTSAIDSERLRRLCLEAGADDVGFVELDREERCFPM